ncbi:MAG: hypothetical protein RBR98_00085 [Candidatus Moranbacteria bacterium]|jgi:translation elongation factor EF-G|nr:hypothetical protein [Candidatus Moranbacteria bacterium]NLC30687.1 hypothetical protein [Candidatus Moranbacteria bacterium]
METETVMEKIRSIYEAYSTEEIVTASQKRTIFSHLHKRLIIKFNDPSFVEERAKDDHTRRMMDEIISYLNKVFEKQEVDFFIQDKECLFGGLEKFQSIIDKVGSDHLTFIIFRINELMKEEQI